MIQAVNASVSVAGNVNLPIRSKAFPTNMQEWEAIIHHCPFLQLYEPRPNKSLSLFDLETVVMKRMEILAYIDSIRNSPVITGSADLMQRVTRALNENFAAETQRAVLKRQQDDAQRAGKEPPKVVEVIPKDLEAGVSLDGSDGGLGLGFSAFDDAVSHLSCRLVFCQSEQWREWFVRHEEVMFRARVEKLTAGRPEFRATLFEIAKIPCTPVDVSKLDPQQIEWLTAKYNNQNRAGKLPDLFYVPISHAARAMRSRSCLCVRGKAIVTGDSVFDAYMGVFRAMLHQGLRESAILRQQVLLSNSDDSMTEALTNVLRMLDAFFARFIVDPSDSAKPAKEGSVTPADVPGLSMCHFPPCMKRTEEHLRREHHLKHHGRWSYGLFLKAIGMTMEDSLKLFGTLLTLKASKDFEKSAYAYNIRHAYGKEGKRTSYSSLTCTSIVNAPPNLDKYDCHGCPFRFKDESALRTMLALPRPSVLGNGAMIKVAQHDIEDIVQDSREMHYTRACFKYFTATHAGAKLQRDSLFRSPYDYYTTSTQLWLQQAGHAASPGGAITGASSPAVKRERGDEVTPVRTAPLSEATKTDTSA